MVKKAWEIERWYFFANSLCNVGFNWKLKSTFKNWNDNKWLSWMTKLKTKCCDISSIVSVDNNMSHRHRH